MHTIYCVINVTKREFSFESGMNSVRLYLTRGVCFLLQATGKTQNLQVDNQMLVY